MSRTKQGDTIIRPEFPGRVLGVPGRFTNVIVDYDNRELIRNQTWVSERRSVSGIGWVQCTIRFDDRCRNGHNTFSVTGETPDSCGCIHGEIRKAFPELSQLIKWHLTSSDGPMHYVANTLYHAGDRDHNGLREGEVSRWQHVIRFGDSPVSHRISKSLSEFIANRLPGDGTFSVVAIAHAREPQTYKPKYTLCGYTEKWHECPFDSQAEALEWCRALNLCKVTLDKLPTEYSQGKARDLDAARSCAVWHDATDAELCLPPDELKELLLARLPALMEEFKRVVLSCGFLWEVSNGQG